MIEMRPRRPTISTVEINMTSELDADRILEVFCSQMENRCAKALTDQDPR